MTAHDPAQVARLSTDTPRRLRRDLLLGAVVGAVLGLVLAVGVAVADFPEWGRTLWSFILIAAVTLLPLALTLRLVAHGLYRIAQHGIPRERHQPTPDYLLTVLAPGNIAGSAAISAYVILLAAFAVGDGRTSPF